MACLQGLRLTCSLPWPLSAVLDPACLEQLSAVHAFLLQVLGPLWACSLLRRLCRSHCVAPAHSALPAQRLPAAKGSGLASSLCADNSKGCPA